ncbi:MAG: hypothetical protein LBT23_02190 [Synergistaceae bacterium]|jgi:hypothetical protein|nr:hypothetical protein [Synergistaceae bacterium]
MSDTHIKFETPGEHVFRVGDAEKIFQYAGFRYSANSTDSFVRLLKANIKDVWNAVVFVNDKGFHAIVDTSVTDRPQDKIVYDFSLSPQGEEWGLILEKGQVFDVKSMVDFLKRRETGEIDTIEDILYAAQNFRYVIKSEGDFTRDNSQNYVMAIKVGEAEGTIKVPEKIYANIALLKGSDFTQSIEIEVDIHRPKDEKDGKPGFHLSCPKFERYYQRAILSEVAALKHELGEFLVIDGAPGA